MSTPLDIALHALLRAEREAGQALVREEGEGDEARAQAGLGRGLGGGAEVLPFEPAGVDLNTLLSEMTALKQEIRAETTASRQVREAFEGQSQRQQQAGVVQQRHEEQLQQLREQGRRDQARLLMEMLDKLERSVQSAQVLAERRVGWFRKRRDPAVESLAEGLELWMASTRERLSALGVEAFGARGERFEPAIMEAEGTAWAPELAEGVVVQVLRWGYRDAGQVLRAARVVVNRRAAVPALLEAKEKT